jgi:Fur family ferric uptake transcriptional regulator
MEFPMETQELRKAGLKVTQPRMRILEILETSSGKHMTAEDIYRELIQHHSDVGLATVYRVLTQFEAAGLVLKHNFEGGQAVYEIDRGKHHDHMVDVDTGKVIEFTSEAIEKLQHEIAERHGYAIEDHSLVLYVRAKKKKTP